MKKSLWLLAVLLLWPAYTTAQEKTDDQLLTETVALAKEVKEFGRTLGIEPTETLSKVSKEQSAESRLWVWVQKKGSLSFETSSVFVLRFKDVKEKIPLSGIGILSGNVSIYWRSENQFASSEATITIDFAQEQRWRQVEVIFHEDFHQNLNPDMPLHDNETITTAIARLAALEYFKHKNDDIGSAEIKIRIQASRKFSQDLLKLAEDASKAIDNEAQITHDLAYYKNFDRIVSLYEKSGDLKTLVEDMKVAPGQQNELEKYLDELEAKYSARNSPNPLLP